MKLIHSIPLFAVAALAAGYLLLPHEAQAANLYWVGADAANFSVSTNWKTTDPASCGGGNAMSAPGSMDVAIFDADCDNGATMDTTVNVQGIDLKSGYTGSVTPSSAIAITAGGSGFIQAGGTFTSTSGTFIVRGTFTRSGGTFTHNSGTVSFETASSSYTITATDTTFYNVRIEECSNSCVPSGFVATLASSFTVANDLTVENASLGNSLTVEGSSSPTITVSGAFSLPSNGSTATITFGSSTAANNFTVNVSGNFSQAEADATTHATLIMGGSGTHTWSKTAGVFNGDFKVNKSGGEARLATALATATANQDVIVEEGTFDLTGFNLTVNNSGSTLIVEDGGVLQLQGDETITANTGYPQLDSGSTVTYDGTAGPYTVKEYTYHHLRFNGSGGTFNLGAAEAAAGNLTVSNGTFSANGQTMTVTGTATVSGGTYTASSATQTFNGGLTVSGGTFTGSTGTVDVNGALEVSSGTLTTPSSGTFSISGNFTHSGGTFTHNSGTVTLDGADQTLSGATTFNHLTKTVTTARTLTFPTGAGSAQTIVGTTTLQGASGALLSLRSASSGTQWQFDPQGTRTFSYLDVKDSYNTNSTSITTAGLNITDSGNNTGWNFGTANTAPEATKASSISQATDGSGLVTFKTTLSDSNSDVTRLRVEYASELGDWKDLTLDTATASRGSITVDNNATYQISSVDTDGGSVELTIIWKSKVEMPTGEDTTVYLRLTPNDSTTDGTIVTSDAFTVDNKTPGITRLELDDRTATSLTLQWTPGATDPSWQKYTLCYGLNATHVKACNKTAKIWTPTQDSELAVQNTTTTTITGLATGKNYKVLLRAHDSVGNVATLFRGNLVPTEEPLNPLLAVGTITDTTVAVQWSRLKAAGFQKGELCYGQVLANVSGASCVVTGDPSGATKKTYTSALVLSDVVTALKMKTKYYFKYFAFYTGFSTKGSNVRSATTCPAGKQRINGVCVFPPPSPSPTPSPPPPPVVSPTPTPLATPDATPVPSPLPEELPSPTPASEDEEPGPPFLTATIEFIKKVINVIKQTIVRARAALKPIVEHPAFKVATVITTAAAIVSVAASASALTSAPSLLSQLPQAIQRLWQGLLGLFGFRRKKRPWGRVVDASTGEPVAGAYVQVFDHQTKRLQNTMVTNTTGAFSSLVPPGMYEFRVYKPGWTLTPQAPFLRLIAGERIYDGKPLAVTEEKVLPLVLALRMTEAVPLTHHLLWRKTLQTIELFIARLSWPLLILGSLLNSLAVFAAPTTVNMAVEVFYILLISWKLRLRFKRRPAIGYVRDAATNRPLDLALVRVYDAVTGRLVETRTTTAEGKFLFLPSPGVYTISVVREGYAPYREGHVVVNPKREALALAFTLKPLPLRQFGVSMATPAA